AGRVLLGSLPLAIILAVGFQFGEFSDTVFVVLGLGFVLVTITHFVSLRLLQSQARAAGGALGPTPATAVPRRPSPAAAAGSPAARAISPAMLRLDRSWRDHARSFETSWAAAEAIIAAVPDPLIVIDRQRRIVRSNAAAAEFVTPGGEPRDLAAALRNPQLLA